MDENRYSNNSNGQLDRIDLGPDESLGRSTSFACPKCNDILWEFGEGDLLYFRCHLDHIYSPKSLLIEQMVALKMAFRHEIRVFKEKQSWLTKR
jgi:two-component system chemotaxis response regulator CheB